MRISFKIILCISMLIVFCNFASASPILPPDDILESYDIDSDNLTIIEQDDEAYDNNVIGSLTLSLDEDFGKPTFSSGKNISGEAVEGSSIITLVYNIDSDDEVEMIYENSQTIGASAMYRETLQFEDGKNYILIIVNDDDSFVARQFVINKKEKETKKRLESGYIDITKSVDDNIDEEDENNIFDSYIKDLNKDSGFIGNNLLVQNLLRSNW